MDTAVTLKALINSVLFSLIGVGVFTVWFLLFDRITPGKIWHEILEEHNTALAIIVGALSIGIAHIIAMAIHG